MLGLAVLLLTAMTYAPGAAVEEGAPWPPPPPTSATVTFVGRFGPGGSAVAMAVVIPFAPRPDRARRGFSAVEPTFRLQTDECRDRPSAVATGRLTVEQPLAAVDLDGDGRDEVFLHEGGATVDLAALVRVEGCNVTCVTRADERGCAGFAFYGHGATPGGLGVFCRRTASGAIEILEIGSSPYALDKMDPQNWTKEKLAHVAWTRRTSVLRGAQLVTIAEDKGESRVENDPSVPLINGFDCLRGVYPP